MVQKIDVSKIKKQGFEEELNILTNYKPNNWQKHLRKEDYRFKVICAGRRSGKTHYVVNDTKDGLVTDLVLPQQHVWVVAPNYDLTQRVWSELFHLAVSKFNPTIKTLHNTKGDFKIETHAGTIIEAKSADEPEKLVGVGLTKIVIDEAALVKEKAWTQSLRPTLMDHRGKALFISTPKGKNWFWQLWEKGQEKAEVEWGSWRYTSYENEYLDREEIDKLVKDMPEFEYRQEILATFEETAEQLFRNVKERTKDWMAKYGKTRLQEGEFIPPKRGHRYQIGVDLGRKTSYSVITVIDEMEYPYPVVYFDRFKTIDWNLQKARIKEVWKKYPALRLRIDATGVGDPFVEGLEDDGIRIDPYIYKEISKKQLIDKTAILIQEGNLIYPPIRILLGEMETFGREISPKTGRIKYKAMGRNLDDTVHSLALASWGLMDKPRKPREKEDKKPFKPISGITGY